MEFCVTDRSTFLSNTHILEVHRYRKDQLHGASGQTNRWTTSFLVSSREEARSRCSPSQDLDGGAALK